MASSDAPVLIAQAARAFIEEVPALAPLTLVVGVDLKAKSDTRQFRLELPSMEVRKGSADDARIRIEMQRAFFNAMVEHEAKLADWREAFEHGQAKATGVQQYLELIKRVVEKAEERARTRKARS